MRFFSFLGLFTMFFSTAFSKIIPISCLQEALFLTEPSDQTRLLALDIDHTLLGREHPATHPRNLKSQASVIGMVFSPLKKEHKEEALMLTLKTSNPVLIEEEAPELIREFQSKGHSVIALTATITGPLGDSPRAEIFRYEELLKFGFDFSSSFEEQEIVLTTLPQYRNQHPVFYKGVLCSNGERGPTDKGLVLVEFLKQVRYKPDTIVMVDDKLQNLEDLQKALKSYDPSINYYGYYYTGADSLPFTPVSAEEMQEFATDLVQQLGF